LTKRELTARGSDPIAKTFETLLLTENDEIKLNSLVEPLMPKELAEAARFVRLDCAVGQTARGPGIPLSVWACLGEQPPDAIDSIGIYTNHRSLFAPELKERFCGFAAKTSRSQMSYEAVTGFLDELRNETLEIMQKHSYSF
jgi:hypothetical protein